MTARKAKPRRLLIDPNVRTVLGMWMFELPIYSKTPLNQRAGWKGVWALGFSQKKCVQNYMFPHQAKLRRLGVTDVLLVRVSPGKLDGDSL